jgi:hypothetical protein
MRVEYTFAGSRTVVAALSLARYDNKDMCAFKHTHTRSMRIAGDHAWRTDHVRRLWCAAVFADAPGAARAAVADLIHATEDEGPRHL